jgi:CubicO group peptidase (beta-lactamase class C family)
MSDHGPNSDAGVRGYCHPRYAAVEAAFRANFEEELELGARCSFIVDGETVVDLIGGWADRGRTTPFGLDTLTPVFSTTKALAATMVARLVDQGKLSYDQRVIEVWPEFGQQGKDRLTVAQVLSHQGGMAGFVEPIEPGDWFDWDKVCARIAAMAPLWPPGTASGYHPALFGFIAGEIFRRVDGRTLGKALREDIAGPHHLDMWIGLPESEDGRVADVERPKAVPDFGEITEARRAAFLNRWSAPAGRTTDEWRRAEIPSANGHATALALAKLMSALAGDGTLDGRTLLSPATIAAASEEQISGPDLVLPFWMSWGCGYMRSGALGVYGPDPDAFGHSGWGGSCAFAAPRERLAGAYVMNRQSAALLADPRSLRLVEAVYEAL